MNITLCQLKEILNREQLSFYAHHIKAFFFLCLKGQDEPSCGDLLSAPHHEGWPCNWQQSTQNCFLPRYNIIYHPADDQNAAGTLKGHPI